MKDFILNIIPKAQAQIFTGGNAQKGVEDVERVLEGTGVTSTDNIVDLVLQYVNFALPFMALAAFLGFVYAGVLYVAGFGSDDQAAKAKKVMIYTVAGVIVVILSYSIVQLFTTDLVQGINP